MPHKNKRGKTHPKKEGHTKRGFQEKEEERLTKGARDLNIVI
jgi:hypothetical protein